MTPITRREDDFLLVAVYSSPLIGYGCTLYKYKRRIVDAGRIASLRSFAGVTAPQDTNELTTSPSVQASGFPA